MFAYCVGAIKLECRKFCISMKCWLKSAFVVQQRRHSFTFQISSPTQIGGECRQKTDPSTGGPNKSKPQINFNYPKINCRLFRGFHLTTHSIKFHLGWSRWQQEINFGFSILNGGPLHFSTSAVNGFSRVLSVEGAKGLLELTVRYKKSMKFAGIMLLTVFPIHHRKPRRTFCQEVVVEGLSLYLAMSGFYHKIKDSFTSEQGKPWHSPCWDGL